MIVLINIEKIFMILADRYLRAGLSAKPIPLQENHPKYSGQYFLDLVTPNKKDFLVYARTMPHFILAKTVI